MATNPKKTKEPKYSKQQKTAIDSAVKAIKKVYGNDVDSKTINNILGNIEVETGWKKLRETPWTTSNLDSRKDNPAYKSITGNYTKWKDASKKKYNTLTKGEKLSVMYYGDTDHKNVAGGTGVLQLTSAGYGGNDATEKEIEKAAKDLGLNSSELSSDFYNSTLLTLQVYKDRGVDFSTYESARDARKSTINPYEKYEDLSENSQSSLNNNDFEYSESIKSGSSIDPSVITNSPGLDKQGKDELRRLNEEAGLQPNTANQLLNQGSPSPFSNLLNSSNNNILTPGNELVNQELDLRSNLEPIVDITKQRPENQQNKPQSQETSTQFLENYLKTNKFELGGNVSNCGGPGQPPCKPIMVDNKNDPRYKAYQDSLSVHNKGQQILKDNEGKPIFNRFNVDKNDDGSYVNIEDYDLPQNTVEASDRHGLVAEEIVVFDNRKKGDKANTGASSVGLFKKPTQPFEIGAEKPLKKIYPSKSKKSSTGLQMKKTLKSNTKPEKAYQGKYGFFNDSGEFKKYDATNDWNSQQDYNKAKNKQGFRNINEFAMGGPTKQQSPQTEGGMTHIPESSGSHEQNPNGGVQIGMGSNGSPNTAEGGETMNNNYVYSDKLILDETILKKVGLNKKFKGKSIAEASKLIQSPKDEQPNDKVVADTADENLEKLKNANEVLRLTEELLDPSTQSKGEGQHQMPDGSMMDGESHNAPQQQFLFGGLSTGLSGQQIGTDKYGNLAPGLESNGVDAAGVLGAAGAGMGMAKEAFGPTGVDTSGKEDYVSEGGSIGGSVASGAASGAMAGMAFGPWGAAAGGLLGGAASGIGALAKQDDQSEARTNSDIRNMNNMARNGGQMNQYVKGGPVDPTDPNFLFKPQQFLGEPRSTLPTQESNNFLTQKPEDTLTRNMPSRNPSQNVNFLQADNSVTPFYNPSGTPPTLETTQSQKGREADSWWERNGSKLGDTAANAARYASPLMTGAQYLSQDKADVESLDRLDSRYKPNYVDERSLQNTAQSNYNNAANSLKGASGGSQSALRANLLGAHLNRTKGISDSYMKADQINRGEDNRAQQFNLGVDKTNLNQSNQEKNINAANQGAYDTNRQRLLSQIGTDIGAIGLEETRKKYPEKLGLLYDYLGKHIG